MRDSRTILMTLVGLALVPMAVQGASPEPTSVPVARPGWLEVARATVPLVVQQLVVGGPGLVAIGTADDVNGSLWTSADGSA